MTDLLTTRQLMDMLHLDRTTIYRMLNDGQLPAVRVGGQWRFSREAIEAWFQTQTPAVPAAEKLAKEPPLPAPSLDSGILPLHCVQPIQEVFAQIADVGAVTTELSGEPLTPFSNGCTFCRLILSTEEGRARCQADWRRLAEQAEPRPRLEKCHAGLTYARGRITVQDHFIAMIFGGQFLVGSPGTALPKEKVAQVAQACGVDEGPLQWAAGEIHIVEQRRAEKLLEMLQLIADTFSSIGQERFALMSRLKMVAEIAGAGQVA